jgi:protein TonB
VSTPEGDPGDPTVRELGDGAAASVDDTTAPVADRTFVAEPADSERIVEPVRVSAESAVYPPLARAADIQGEVRLVAHVGPDGTVTQVDVVQAPHPLLADAARKAVLRYRYTPGSRDGTPSQFRVPVTVRFRLQ